MKRQLVFLLESVAFGFIVASIAGGWIVLLKPPVVKEQISYWWFVVYWANVTGAIRCVIYLCYEQFIRPLK